MRDRGPARAVAALVAIIGLIALLAGEWYGALVAGLVVMVILGTNGDIRL